MSRLVLPVARPLALCDAVTPDGSGKVSLSGVFDAIRATGFPHAGTRVVVFAQLVGGIGTVPVRLVVRHAARDEVIYRSDPYPLRFTDRLTALQVSLVLTRCVFPYPGLYTVELFCHNQFMCDTTLHLLGPGETR
ncbi:MAG: hypothetical protein U0871_23910 [Gemmataceae bacterium]